MPTKWWSRPAYRPKAIVDSAVNDANGIRQSPFSIQTTCSAVSRPSSTIPSEGARGRFDAFMTSMQSRL